MCIKSNFYSVILKNRLSKLAKKYNSYICFSHNRTYNIACHICVCNSWIKFQYSFSFFRIDLKSGLSIAFAYPFAYPFKKRIMIRPPTRFSRYKIMLIYFLTFSKTKIRQLYSDGMICGVIFTGNIIDYSMSYIVIKWCYDCGLKIKWLYIMDIVNQN